MPRRLLILGLDCLGAELLDDVSLAELPTVASLVASGCSGPLTSVVPPITVPAWTSLLTGRDPGELGVYGFRNRPRYDYSPPVRASSLHVRFPRLWDFVDAAGGSSIVIGVPQTSPPPTCRGVVISGFDATAFAGPRLTPASIEAELGPLWAEYRFDVEDFRDRPRLEVLAELHSMLNTRFSIAERLLTERAWDFAMICEIGSDRLHHCFWSDHDPNHPRYNPSSPYRDAVRNYYRALDRWIARMLACIHAGVDDVLLASDHGAQPMLGGVCVNEVLREAGWLTLRDTPREPARLTADMVDWSRTRAWAEGGYSGRIFLNVAGREPLGTVAPEEMADARSALAALFSSLDLPDGPRLCNQVVWPEREYRAVRGCAPDLLVLFGELRWRALGTVGHGRIWLDRNDAGPDDANHAFDGLYVLCGPGVPHRTNAPASILDLAPTLLARLGLEAPADLRGRNLTDEPPLMTPSPDTRTSRRTRHAE